MPPQDFIWSTTHSPFASVIGTNYSPTSDELKNLQALLAGASLESKRIEAELARVHTPLDIHTLSSQKQTVEDFINNHIPLQSPIRQIPSEILAAIFVHCHPEHQIGFAVPNPRDAPLIFTTISRDWRRIALNTPRLWNRLHFMFYWNVGKDTGSRRVVGVTSWLERSIGLPLTVSFHCTSSTRDVVQDTSLENVHSMIHSLMKFSDRLRHIFLSLPSVLLSAFTASAPSVFPMLTSLKVEIRCFNDALFVHTESHAKFSSILSRMPLLEEWDISHQLEHNDHYLSWPCNWKNLTIVSIKDLLTPDEVITLLSRTPNLRSFSLVTRRDGTPRSLQKPALVLPNLQEIYLIVNITLQDGVELDAASSSNSRTTFTSIFDRIQCSALRLLWLRCQGAMEPLPTIFSWLPFAELPLENLESLMLNMSLTPEALQECLNRAPKLIRFQYIPLHPAGNMLDSHLLSLTTSEDNPILLCPRLENITVIANEYRWASTDPCFTIKGWIRFLQYRSRMNFKSCLVVFPEEPSIGKVELDILQEMKKRFQIEIERLKRYPFKMYPVPCTVTACRPTLIPGRGFASHPQIFRATNVVEIK